MDSALYEHLPLSRDKLGVAELARREQVIKSPKDLIKDPYLLEFLGLEQRPHYTESDLETAIIDQIERFLLELGKGFSSAVGRCGSFSTTKIFTSTWYSTTACCAASYSWT